MQVSTNVCDGPKTGLNEIKKNRMVECQHNNMDKQKKPR